MPRGYAGRADAKIGGMSRPPCYLDDCDRPQYGQGLCLPHYDRQRKAAIRNGTWESIYVDAEPFKKRIRQFIDAGYSFDMLQAVTGIERNTLHLSVSRDRKEVLIDNADSLARTPLLPLWRLWRRDIGLDYQVPKYLATRRVQALLSYGWEVGDIADCSGLHKRVILRIYSDSEGMIFRSSLMRVDHAFRELAALPRPTHMKPARAKKFRHWPVPFEWDTEELDHPDGWEKPQRRAGNRLRQQLSEGQVGAV